MIWLLVSLAASQLDSLSILRSKQQRNGLIKLTPKELSDAIYKAPRNYDLVVFMYDSRKHSKQLVIEFREVAQLYAQRTFDPPVFFTAIEITDALSPILKKLKVTYTPILLVSKPQMANPLEATFNDLRNLKRFFWMITERNGHVTADKLTEYINARTEQAVPYKKSSEKLSESFANLLIFGSIGCFSLYMFWGVVSSPTLWMITSIILYPVFQSGVLKSVIDGVLPNTKSVVGASCTALAGLCLLFIGLLPTFKIPTSVRFILFSTLLFIGALMFMKTEASFGGSTLG